MSLSHRVTMSIRTCTTAMSPICVRVTAFSYSACGDDFVTIYADGEELVGMREINTTVSADIPVRTRVIGIKYVTLSYIH
jgi:hypothetical protein